MKKKLFKNKYGNRNHFKHKRKRTSLSISLLLKIYKFLLKIIKLLFFLFTIKLILIKNQFDNDIVIKRQYKDEYMNIKSDKWIVMTASNPPSNLIIDLEAKIKKWKIIVIGNNKTTDSKWDIFINSKNLIYLSIINQSKLEYNILKYIKNDSKCRKNIGYLFAIQHGAKEIYEIDENLNISNYDSSFLDINIHNSYLCYGVRNDKIMINPYVYFRENNIWPRGFLYKDIISDYNNTFYYTHSSKVNLKPLVYQGLINEIPDVDSIFMLSNFKVNDGGLNITFLKNEPLIYLPGNYVPINSKCAKYIYDIFPFLLLPITINESISDILRGYILERFVYEFQGTVVFYNTKFFNRNNIIKKFILVEEKQIIFNLNKILDIIKSKTYSKKRPQKLMFSILSELINNNILKKEELEIYKAYLDDLSNIGYNFSKLFTKKRNNKVSNYLNISSELIYHRPTNPIILRNNNISYQIMKHSYNNKVYNDILLIINYNNPGYLKLNEYLEKLYKNNFPNIVYLYPGKQSKKEPNIIKCKESHQGYYSYRCIEYIYKKYPNYKGYLLTNDDNYLKIWELENLDFSIPWFYIYEPNGYSPAWMFSQNCNKLYDLCDKNVEWKYNLTKYYGKYKIFNGISDLYYIPDKYISQFINLVKKMYHSRIFLECAVHSSFAIISASRYHVFYIKALYDKDRDIAVNILRKDFKQISIHPIKFSNEEFKKGVLLYNYFINANEF